MFAEEKQSYFLAYKRIKKDKMKAHMPTLREKKRYLVFEVIAKSKISIDDLSRIIVKTLNNFFGELEGAKANIKVLKDKWDMNKQKGIIKVNRRYINQLKAALCTITKVKNSKVIVRSTGVSGILKKTNKFMV